MQGTPVTITPINDADADTNTAQLLRRRTARELQEKFKQSLDL